MRVAVKYERNKGIVQFVAYVEKTKLLYAVS